MFSDRRFPVLSIVLAFSLLLVVVLHAFAHSEDTSRQQTDVSRQAHREPSAISNIIPATAEELALAMGIPSNDLASADLMGSDTAGVGVSLSPLGEWFPTEGGSFAILATGLAADAELPDNEPDHSYELDGLNNDQGQDLVRLHVELDVPDNINCASFDFAFYSEEFPEFVGSQFNDTFTAQLNESAINVVGDEVVAPGNFAFDTENHVISVNTVFGVTANTGTTYDGTTPSLRARTAVVPGSTIDIYLSVQDLGDSIYDSAVFLDRFFWSADPSCIDDGAQVDTDGDGLLDNWETNGLTVTVGGVDEFVDLPTMGADPNHKDIFVEIDYMEANDHNHRPGPAAIQLIVDAFDNASVPANDSDPGGATGIHLHVDYGSDAPLAWGSAATWGALSQAESLSHRTYLSTCSGSTFNWGGATSFDSIKQDHFTAGRAAVFHYSIWAHHLCSSFGTTSGISRNDTTDFEAGGSDFVVSLGGWANTTQQQAGTFMHELGHNLGLRHGGPDHLNYKPNYLSVMNYSFQTRGLIIDNTAGHFDYSRYDLAELDEIELDEPSGIGVPATIGTYHFCGTGNMQIVTDASSVDWNCDGDTSDSELSYNINEGFTANSTLSSLASHDDWAHIVFSGGAISQPGASVELPTQSEVIDIDAAEDAQIPSVTQYLYLPLLLHE